MIPGKNWIEEYQNADALWLHDGDPKTPHALLTSGLHSDGFFNSRKITQVPGLLSEAAENLVDMLVHDQGDLSAFDVVVGPQTGATRLAEYLGYRVGMERRRICHFASPKKIESGGHRSMHFDERDTETVSGKRVIICDDVLTTGGSISLAEEAVTAIGGKVYDSYILALVNRSGQTHIDGRKVISLITRNIASWESDHCPLCKAGSVAIRPKDNWNLLTGKKAA